MASTALTTAADPAPLATQRADVPAASADDTGAVHLDKPRRIPKRIAEAVRLLITGECKTVKAAAGRAELNYTHLCETLKKPHVRVFIERRARETIAAGMLRASPRLIELLDANSEHVSFEATKHVLALGGIKPAAEAQVSVNIELKAGYVIDLREPVQVIDGERAA